MCKMFNTESSFYFYFSSRAIEFTTPLAERLRFEENDEWLCGLIQYQWSNIRTAKESLYLCGDMFRASCVNNHMMPILTRLDKQMLFNHITYVPVKSGEYESIDLYLRDMHGEYPSFNISTLHGTLHFKKRTTTPS